MAVPQVRMDAVQRIVLAAKIHLLHVSRAQKATVERIRPAVVRTLDAAFEMTFGRRTDAGAAVTADVEKSMNVSACIAGHNNALAGDLAQNEVAGTRNFGLAA